MSSHPRPTTTEELLATLRATRLVSEESLARLADAWDTEAPAEARTGDLITAGLLTPYQVELILAGKARRLNLGPYRLLDRLGAGGMGKVYRAEHRLMKRLVALKVLGRSRVRLTSCGSQPTDKRTPSNRPRKRREIETAARLIHPHIVRSYDAIRLRGRLVLVMEYVEGIDLARLLDEGGPLPVGLACEIVRQTAQALGYMHEQGLIHRDVKPGNLLLTHDKGPGTADFPDGRPVIKLLDLGLTSGRMTHADGELCGTMDYLAPECAHDPLEVDHRADLYSLGCTFYHLLAGRVPFPGGTWTAKLLKHRLDSAVPLSDIRPGVPAAVSAIVERLLAREPEERYPSAAAVTEALLCFANPSRERERPDQAQNQDRALTLPARTERPTGSARKPFPLQALFWSIVLGVLTGATARIAGTEAEPTPEPIVQRRGIEVSGLEDTFTDLARAFARAGDGAIITLHDAGPHRVESLSLNGRRLTVRAPAAQRATLEHQGTGWHSLIEGEGDLTLERLDLTGPGETAPLLSVEKGSVNLRGCRLISRGIMPLVSLRKVKRATLEACRLTGGGVAVIAEQGPACRVRLDRCVIEAREAVLALWASENTKPGSVEVEMRRSRLSAHRVLGCQSTSAPVRVQADGNRFTFRQLYSAKDGVLSWSESSNEYRKITSP